ncbi:MAG TPA: hypothetical protein VGL00_19975 [Terracidiphilus sp.]|jgi:hypothetical protein
MHSSTHSVSHPLPPSRNGSKRTHEDVVYQIVTVAAILLVLGSIWVF